MKKFLFASTSIVALFVGIAFAAGPFTSKIEVGNCSGGDFVTGYGATGTRSCGTPTGITFANPTATAGPTAVNGVSTDAMRSDAAPAVQLACGDLSNGGTACPANTGTSGATLGLLNANKTDSGNNNFTGINQFATGFGSTPTAYTTNHTLDGSECGKEIAFDSASDLDLTTLASIVSSGQGCAIAIRRMGVGNVTIVDGAGATHVSANSCTKARAQYSLFGISVRGDSVSQYYIDGDCS